LLHNYSFPSSINRPHPQPLSRLRERGAKRGASVVFLFNDYEGHRIVGLIANR
jgi:hypothetical protein